MTRYTFPGDLFLYEGASNAVLLGAGATFRVWTARTGGTDITASMTQGDGVTALLTNGSGDIVADPDGVVIIYVAAVGGLERYPVVGVEPLEQALLANPSSGFVEDPANPGFYIPGSGGTGGTTDPEVVRDTMATALQAGTNVTITPNDAANTITIAASGTTDPEVVRDTMATALVAGSNVTITPNDLANTITIASTASGGSGGGSNVTLTVAANDASTHSKTTADYLCDGVDDHVQINTAIAALPTNGGKVELSEGNFDITSSILIQNDNVTLAGVGAGQRSGGTQTGTGTRLLADSGIASNIIR